MMTMTIGDGNIQVSIKDTGTGLSPAILPKLYSKFVSTDSGGTGLGLFVSRNIIESHGGKIEAQNNPDGRVQCFRLLFQIEPTCNVDYGFCQYLLSLGDFHCISVEG